MVLDSQDDAVGLRKPEGHGRQVQQMFSGLAPSYDRANHLLSAGTDRRWRRAAVAFAGSGRGNRVLDVCAGTGDLALAFAADAARVIGVDFTVPMLARARDKSVGCPDQRRPAWVAGDALHLPFRDGSFDLCTVAFGIRNVSDPVAGLAEMRRVTRSGGRVLVLEFCRPRAPVLAPLYRVYFRRVLPLLGRWITGDRSGAYTYLPDTVMAFPEREEFLALMRRAGLSSPVSKILSCGIAALYRAEVP
ncbi:MAG: bifunctional demethylmenaquinone methyltransferase/2-methoxy-6-polyprenyl-1,4-benzoquinol methylase UbiE [Planctomycetes bacterium]|nr:bifunctional demethylmenaquinone methyltransferase/2-methoxy-6-polyprenyl-1,4-benzoquinol methylase UbiE [Planctomycetota bacterium]